MSFIKMLQISNLKSSDDAEMSMSPNRKITSSSTSLLLGLGALVCVPRVRCLRGIVLGLALDAEVIGRGAGIVGNLDAMATRRVVVDTDVAGRDCCKAADRVEYTIELTVWDLVFRCGTTGGVAVGPLCFGS